VGNCGPSIMMENLQCCGRGTLRFVPVLLGAKEMLGGALVS